MLFSFIGPLIAVENGNHPLSIWMGGSRFIPCSAQEDLPDADTLCLAMGESLCERRLLMFPLSVTRRLQKQCSAVMFSIAVIVTASNKNETC